MVLRIVQVLFTYCSKVSMETVDHTQNLTKDLNLGGQVTQGYSALACGKG